MLLKNPKEGEGDYKLIDFGLTCSTDIIASEISCLGDAAGTPGFLAPEVLDRRAETDPNKYAKTADVYAVGVTLYKLLTGGDPYELDKKRYYYPVGNYIEIDFSDKAYNCLNDVIALMVEKDPNQRYPTEEAKQALTTCAKYIASEVYGAQTTYDQ